MYDQKWVPAALHDGQAATGQQALLIFCERQSVNDPKYIYHPIRFAEVESAWHDANAGSFALKLGHLWEYAPDGSWPDSTAFQLLVMTRKDESPSSVVPDVAPKFVSLRPPIRMEEKQRGDWRSLATHFTRLRGLETCTLFAVYRPTEGPAIPNSLLENPSFEVGREQYTVASGRTERLILRTVRAAKADFQLPLPQFPESIGSVNGPFIRQLGDDVEVEYLLVLKRALEQEVAMLSVAIPMNIGEVRSPMMQAIVTRNPPSNAVGIAIAALTVGSFLTSISPEFIRSNAAAVTTGPSDGHILLTAWITKLIGIGLLAIGSFIGFRRVPFKTS